MLSSCERYNIKKGKWNYVATMCKNKCAFAATEVNNEFIYTFGGFNGLDRLNTIEKYSVHNDKWMLINLKFKQAFSNGSAVSH